MEDFIRWKNENDDKLTSLLQFDPAQALFLAYAAGVAHSVENDAMIANEEYDEF